jgi:HEAT repeat protein
VSTGPARGVRLLVEGLRDRLDFRPEDRKAALLVTVLHALLASAFVAGFTARDAIFLGHAPLAQLPAAYVASALASALGAALVFAIGRRVTATLFFPAVAAAAGSVIFGVALVAWKLGEARAALPAFVGVDLALALTAVPLWTLTETQFTARDTKRAIDLADAARVGIVLLAGLWTWGVVHVLRPRDLLWVCAGLLWLAAVPPIVLALGRALRGTAGVAASPPFRISRLRAVADLPHVSLLAAIVTLGVLATTLADFQFKTALASRDGGDPASIARFSSGFAACQGAVAIVLAFCAGPLLSSRFGAVGLLLGCAVATGAGAIGLLASPTLAVAAIVRSTHELLRFSGSEAAVPRFLAPLPRRLRDDALVFVARVVQPLAAIGAGALLLAAGRMPHVVSLATGASAVLLAVALLRLRVELARSRQYALKQSGVETAAEDELAFVPAALASRDEREVEMSLELATRLAQDLSVPVVQLLQHETPRVRQLALDYLARRGTAEIAERVRGMLSDEDAGVRASAIHALACLLRARAKDPLLPFISAPEAPVRAAAAAGLFFFGGDSGQAASARPLRRLLESAEPTDRVAVAEALAAIGLEDCTQVVWSLLEDPDARVRRAALRAAGRIRSEELLPTIVDALERDETARAAGAALTGYGERVLGTVFRQRRGSPRATAEVSRLLGRLATRASALVLLDHLDEPDEALRAAVFSGLARAATRAPGLALDRPRLEAALLVEAAAAYRALAMSHAVRVAGRPGERATELLLSAIEEKHERALARLLDVAQALHPHALLARASAVEALPALLSAPLRKAVLPLLEPGAAAATKLAGATGLLKPPVLSIEAWVCELLTDRDRWVLCAAAHYAGAKRLEGVVGRLQALLERRDPVIRETALHALEQLLPISRLPAALKPVIWDEDDMIKDKVDTLLERIVDQVELDRAGGAVQEAFR